MLQPTYQHAATNMCPVAVVVFVIVVLAVVVNVVDDEIVVVIVIFHCCLLYSFVSMHSSATEECFVERR